ncbi:hypothetical protein [Aminivibrio sp.]|jgi:uncharacterized coiled-coil protein SlyX|uniref:hypothetical protein n=1 Tax=Aminivibrio sp. TaxID=1872489 RepID=UPI001A3A7023|nr:hypothetical protein [Aminivibrio sp.]MBL3540545.1 hypothetical protein [Aminivibrio sp.]MDK2959246.1 hypothetical protein [Synergistaceae bacterium]
MVTISHIEQLADRLVEMVASLRSERDQLRVQINEMKNKLSEKELECIRLSKENRRNLEILEREKLSFQKEKSQIEGQMKTLYEKLSSLMPEAGQPQANGQDDRGERRP